MQNVFSNFETNLRDVPHVYSKIIQVDSSSYSYNTVGHYSNFSSKKERGKW